MTSLLRPTTAAQVTLRRRVLLVLKIAVSAAAFVWLFHIVKPHDLAEAMGRVPVSALLLACLAAAAAVVFGALRWWVLLDAYGATARPSLGRLLHLMAVGQFYNTLLPGAVGGDVLRGYATRDAFGDGNATAAVAVTLVERVLGLAALLLLTGTLALWRPIAGARGIVPLSIVGVLGAGAALVVVSQGWRIAPRLPGALGRFVSRLPRVSRTAPFAAALALSFGTQLCVTLGVYPILTALVPRLGLVEVASLVPIGLAASYFPFTVGGAGAREGAFVALLSAVGVAHADALATSLLTFATQAVVAALGGVLHLVRPIDAGKP